MRSDRPTPVTPERVLAAAKTLEGEVVRTPVKTSTAADSRTGGSLFFKCENFQKTGSFKFRGASYAIARLTAEERARGVVAFSSGNHAQAIALASSTRGIPVTVVMPSDAPRMKIDATRSNGAEVILYDRLREDREEIAARLQRERGSILIPPFDHPSIIAGQGSAAVELIEEVGVLDYLFVCVGGGGLVSGSALAAHALSPGCRVIGCEPEAGNDGQQAFERGERVKIDVPETIADGARTQSLGALTFPIIRRYVHAFQTASDAELVETLRFFHSELGMRVEPTGCLAAAVALGGKIDLRGKRAGVIVSGGNADAERFQRWISER